MSRNFLEFEQPIAEMQAKIEELRLVTNDNEVNISDEIQRLEAKCKDLTKKICTNLDAWQIAQMAGAEVAGRSWFAQFVPGSGRFYYK